jgi:hypothetical protein
MHWYIYLLTVTATGTFAWFAFALLAPPIQSLFDLRRLVRNQMLSLENVPVLQPRETCITSEQIRRYDTDLRTVREVQQILRDLSGQLLAFGENEISACLVLKPFGFDPITAGHNLASLSNTLDRYGADRATFRKNIENALRFRSEQ